MSEYLNEKIDVEHVPHKLTTDEYTLSSCFHCGNKVIASQHLHNIHVRGEIMIDIKTLMQVCLQCHTGITKISTIVEE